VIDVDAHVHSVSAIIAGATGASDDTGAISAFGASALAGGASSAGVLLFGVASAA